MQETGKVKAIKRVRTLERKQANSRNTCTQENQPGKQALIKQASKWESNKAR